MKQPPADIKQFIEYDRDTGEFRWAQNCGTRGMKGALIRNENDLGYIFIIFRKTTFAAHQLAWWYATGSLPDAEIDHINGDREDNRITNLRLATRSENNRNSSVRKDSKTGVKGVSADGDSFEPDAGLTALGAT